MDTLDWDAATVNYVCEALSATDDERRSLAHRLQARLSEQALLPAATRPPVPLRRTNGLLVFLPPRLADWLLRALSMPDETRAQLIHEFRRTNPFSTQRR